MRVFSLTQVSLAAETAFNDGADKLFVKGFRSDLGGQVDWVEPNGVTTHSIILYDVLIAVKFVSSNGTKLKL